MPGATFLDYYRLKRVIINDNSECLYGSEAIIRQLDADSDGFLSTEEIVKGLKIGHYPQKIIDNMVKKPDKNGDGKISADEFKKHQESN